MIPTFDLSCNSQQETQHTQRTVRREIERRGSDRSWEGAIDGIARLEIVKQFRKDVRQVSVS